MNKIQKLSPIENNILCYKYFRYFHQTNTVKFTIISTIMRAKFNPPIAIIVKNCLLGYVIYFSAGAVYQSKNKLHSQMG